MPYTPKKRSKDNFVPSRPPPRPPISVGHPLPDVDVFENSEFDKVSVKTLFGFARGVLFGVVGALTPQCSEVGWVSDLGFLHPYLHLAFAVRMLFLLSEMTAVLKLYAWSCSSTGSRLDF